MRRYIIALSSLLIVSYGVYSACEDEAFLDACTAKLNEHTFLKAYKVSSKDAKKGKVEYSYVFSKNTNYFLSVCNDESAGGDMIVNLFDKNRRLIATSFDVRTKKHYPAMAYHCTATGVYYLSFEFPNSEGCGVSVLGFQK